MSGATERPSPRRLRRARERGEVAVSRELTAAAALAAGLAGLTLSARWAGGELERGVRGALEAALAPEPSPRAALAAAAATLLRAGAAPLVAALAGGAAAGLATARLFAPAVAAPRWQRLDPAAGLRRLLSLAALPALALGLVRGGLALAAGWWLAASGARGLQALPALSPGALATALAALLRPLALTLAALLLAGGLADLALARRRLARALRMTPEEVRREQRDEQGDPRLRGERRRLHQALAAAGPLSGAAVLVVNPTHLAVALGHRRGSEAPPVVLAKGSGGEAARLRIRARRAGVPVVRDVALARSLFALAEVGDAIPEALYQAAAAVLVRVYRREAGW